MHSTQCVVICGAGHAGTAAAGLLRQHGYTGRVYLLSDEEQIPYHRPPLSKDFLRAEVAIPKALRPEEFFPAQRIELRLGTSAAVLDIASKVVRTAEGGEIGYDALIIATGARPKGLAGEASVTRNGIHTLRTCVDATALRSTLGPGAKLAIIGGGYIGLEVAGSARALGTQVTILERENRILSRVAGSELSEWLTAAHVASGSQVTTSVDVVGLAKSADRSLRGVTLANGDEIPCDAVLVGIGAEPCDGLAREAGIDCAGGIVVDEHGRTSAQGVYAIGDVTCRPVTPYSRSFRLESIQSANEQAEQAVLHILGLDPKPGEVPWFWSDQLDFKIQIAGLLVGAAQSVVRGDPATGKFAVFHLDGDSRLLAAEAVNNASAFMWAKKWIPRRVQIDCNQLGDNTRALKDMVAT